MTLHSYVVRYDSGFAPNPFGGYCTLATCKPDIRRHAAINDWVVGTGSNRRGVRRGGHLVHAMRVTEVITVAEYWRDLRFEKKKPNLHGSYRMACGDNIYAPGDLPGQWRQLNSFHSNADGSPNVDHIYRDTGPNRVLISDDFVYFGGEGPRLPEELLATDESGILTAGIGRRRVERHAVIQDFEGWLRSLNVSGYQGKPWDILRR